MNTKYPALVNGWHLLNQFKTKHIQNYARFFSKYLLPIRRTSLANSYVPFNNKAKSYCQWIVYFNQILPLKRGFYRNIAQHLNENKPRNTNVKVSAQFEHNFLATYSICCRCKCWDFSINNETKLIKKFSKIKLKDLYYMFIIIYELYVNSFYDVLKQ